MAKGVIERYRAYLPVTPRTPVLTLGEGNTPLVPLSRLARRLGEGVCWYGKFEGANPTGSFKDRGMAVAVSRALERGSQVVLCASTGNTSASAAAYGARAGLRTVVLLPQGAVAAGKLAATLRHGATVLAVRGGFDIALQLVRELAARHPITLVNSVNPDRIEGQKTAAFEICEELGDAPDYLAIPVGNAGNITAYWRGFTEFHAAGRVTRRPVLLGVQAAGAAPLVRGEPVEQPETVATAIRIGRPASWAQALRARDESGGRFLAVSDAAILAAYDLLAREEGLFVEPASAASVAGVLSLVQEGALVFRPGTVVVSVLTGHGLKDPEAARRGAPGIHEVEPRLADVERLALS